MTVSLIVDSAADISDERVAAWGVTVIPLKTIFDGTEYLDGVTLSSDEFFEKLVETDTLPTTSAIAPGEYASAFEAELAKGNEVVCITLSSKLSACYQSAVIAASGFEGQTVYVVDSENATLGEQLLVEHAVALRERGCNAQELVEELNAAKKKLRLVALVDTLEYLKRGGRVSASVALVGGLLNIKPVISIENGEVAVLGQARGSKNGRNLLVEKARECGGIDYNKPYLTAYSGLSDALLKKYLADSAAHFPVDVNTIPVCKIGSTIGTHVGPGAVAVAFFSRS